MNVGMLVPAALALGVLAGLPVLAHLARQVPRMRQEFGAMLLLRRVVKRLRRRRRVKDPWLLLLRVLAVLMLVLGVSSPRISYPGGVPEFGGTGRVVVVVDTSMSMSLNDRGAKLIERARTDALTLVDSLPEGALVGLVSFATDAERRTPVLTGDHQQVRARLSEIQPTSGSSNLRGGLLEARRLLGGEAGEVVVFSDEAGPRMVDEAADELRRLVETGSAVIPRVYIGLPPRNIAVVSVKYGDGIEGGQVTVRVANFGPEATEASCEVKLPDGATIPVFVDIPPEGQAEVRITVPKEALGGVGIATCHDPMLELDDARFFHLPRVGASRVLVVDGDPGDTPVRSEVYFLERALAPWGGLKTGVTPDVVTPGGLMGLDSDEHRVVFLSNVSDPRSFGPRITEFVRLGGSLVISAGDNITVDRYNAALGSILPSLFRKTQAIADSSEPGIPLELPTVDHEMFEPFVRSGRSSFGQVRTHRALILEPFAEQADVTTLLRFEGGVPALVERRIGSGRVLVWTSTFDLGWGNLPLQAVFMPMVQRMVAYLGGESGGATARFDAVVDERVHVPLPDLAMEPDVVGPDGSPVRSRIDGSSIVFQPVIPGAYVLQIDGAPPLAYVAVNTDVIESDVRPGPSLAAAEASINPDLFLRHVDLGSTLMGFAFLLMLLQGWVAFQGIP